MDKPVIPQGYDLYNQLMQAIEPELTTDQVSTLEEKYANESDEETAARMDRYEKAYAEYDKAYDAYIANLTEQVEAYRKEAFSSAETKTRSEEESVLRNLESAFS